MRQISQRGSAKKLAVRCAYRAFEEGAYDGGLLFTETLHQFEWLKGLNPAVRQENSGRLKDAVCHDLGIARVLEVSTKSDLLLGVKLSAFSLKLPERFGSPNLESAYQGSKVFVDSNGEEVRPPEWVCASEPHIAKRYIRDRFATSQVAGFDFNGRFWAASPSCLFYDYLFFEAVQTKSAEFQEILDFQAFVDIESAKNHLGFQQGKPFNTQARSAAIYSTIVKNRLIDDGDIESWFYQESIRVDPPSLGENPYLSGLEDIL